MKMLVTNESGGIRSLADVEQGFNGIEIKFDDGKWVFIELANNGIPVVWGYGDPAADYPTHAISLTPNQPATTTED